MMKQTLKFLLALAIAIIIVFAVRAFAFTIYTVPDTSLQPQLRKGERIVVNRLSHVPYRKGDIIVFEDSTTSYIGIITALPGDTIRIGKALYRIPPHCVCRCPGCQFFLVKYEHTRRLICRRTIVGPVYTLFLFH